MFRSVFLWINSHKFPGGTSKISSKAVFGDKDVQNVKYWDNAFAEIFGFTLGNSKNDFISDPKTKESPTVYKTKV